MAVRPSKQHLKLLVLFSGSPYSKLMFSILTNQLVHYGVISVDNASLEDLVRSHFTLWIRMFSPYHACSISNDKKEEWEGSSWRRKKGSRGGGSQLQNSVRQWVETRVDLWPTYSGRPGPALLMSRPTRTPQEGQCVREGRGGGGEGVVVAVNRNAAVLLQGAYY